MRLSGKKPLHKVLIIIVLTLLSFIAIAGTIHDFFSLNLAIINGDMSRVKFLLKFGFDVNAKKSEAAISLPIYFAVCNDNRDMLELLITHGADINSKDNDGTTLLDHAIALNKNIAAKLLVEKGARLNDCTLYRAARNGDRSLIELLIQKGLNVNAACHSSHFKLPPANEYLETPLYATIEKDSSEIAGLLIDNGAIINSQSKHVYTPLHAAAARRAQRTVKLLISRGTNVNAKDEEGHTPLYYATKTEDIEVQRILISAGAIRN